MAKYKSIILFLIYIVGTVKCGRILRSARAYQEPCNGSTKIWEHFVTNQPPEDENKFSLEIDETEFQCPCMTLSFFPEMVLKFDSETNITLQDIPARIYSFGKLEFNIKFYRNYNSTAVMIVRGRQGRPVPNLIGLTINTKNACPNGFKTGHWDSAISGSSNSAVAKDELPLKLYECGHRLVNHVELITNGLETKPGDWPWHAALYKLKASQATQSYICGGSLLNPTNILTAGHCVTELGVKINPERLFAVLGKFNLAGGDIANQEKSIFKIILHPEFDVTNLNNDISILRLSSEVTYNQYVQPICLWERDKISKSKITDKLGTVVGWGFNEFNNVSAQLLSATMPAVSDLTCLRSYPTHFNKFLRSSTYCAGFRNGSSVCNGDSGGGMYFPREDENEKLWFLRGIVSVSVSRDNVKICDPYHYVIFTDVAYYLDWISDNLK